MLIPKILHFVWLQGEEHLAQHEPRYWENVRRARELFGPEWEVKLWDEAALVPLIERVAPHVLPRFLSLPEPAMKADISRFVLMKTYGGIYLDIDFIVKRSLEPLCRLADEPYVALRRLRMGSFLHSVQNGTLSPRPESLQTYVIVSSQGHPLWDRLIDHIATFRKRRLFEHPALYYTRYTCLNALGRAVHAHRLAHPDDFPVVHITHISDFYGAHIGKGEWAGVFSTHGRIRHAFFEDLNWTAAVSLMANVLLLIALIVVIAS